MTQLEQLKGWIQRSKRIAFLGGAGVSTESGIPDFRSENGIFTAIRRYGYPPETLLSHAFFMAHTDVFYAYYRSMLLHPQAEPNAAHLALARLERQGKLTAVITQNIDGLHQRAGSRNVLELHGSVYRNHCMDCHRSFSMEQIKAMPGIPKCACGGTIKPDVVLYGEGLDDAVVSSAVQHIRQADLLIVGGTSLHVYPAAGLVDYFAGDALILINKSETERDGAAALAIHAAIGEVLGAAVGEDA